MRKIIVQYTSLDGQTAEREFITISQLQNHLEIAIRDLKLLELASGLVPYRQITITFHRPSKESEKIYFSYE